ncbi:SIR2 family protein [Paraglaciecola arctica]|uniref:Uncharacterized protein n=1 Tax=Paraglaciecola arctica BSs20135 TaxID=493475 RepID=K6YJC5_9ALTE|nr:SIR2 family protein [Paraglaciecola arctica]GAC18277.1 hypothetical protein GARC_1297 [Paraglaciecola arctica BSs20135]
MRFIDNGPSIPEELLLARDQGRVVFFCGAGVSLAKAGLPDFFGLAEKVIKSLGVTSDSPVHKVLEQAWEVQEKTNVPGLISADRLFGLLEREFYRTDIENAVAAALKSDNPDLSAHQIMIDLATTPTGLVRLVTTNFDRLFNDCDANLVSWQPPTLPSLLRPKDLNGIVYLHGRVSEDYSSAEEDGFILSSAEFGRAYLAEAWATDFFKEILGKYIVVFVGYGADDPPVHYLLEALSKGRENLERIYAFQFGSHEEARAKWQHKGVEAVAYDPADDHEALWSSLEKWAERAKNTEKWYNHIMEMAAKGPRELTAIERGLVAHVISSTEGAKRFAETKKPPPAEWLLAFDKYCRYEKPSRTVPKWDSGQVVDPFELYGLDSDPVPEKTASDDYYSKRELPSDVWDAFDLTHVDKTDRQDSQLSYLRGHNSSNVPELCSRLRNIGIWISKVAADPVTLWWIHRQVDLHPFITGQIEWYLDNQDLANSPEVAKAWRYWLEASKERIEPNDSDWYQLQSRVAKEEWGWGAVRDYLECLRPRLAIDRSYGFAPILSNSHDLNIKSIIRPIVHYPNPTDKIDLPEEWLPDVLQGFRHHLQTVVQFESDIEPFSISDCTSLTPEEDEDDYLGNNSVSILLLRIARTFEALVQNDIALARKEYDSWRNNYSKHFLLLQVWASRNPEIAPFELVEVLFGQELNQDLFWSSSFTRDSLLTLQTRWSEMTVAGQSKIEERIVQGPYKWDQEDDEKFQSRRAWSVLDRLHWLSNNGCVLNCNLDAITKELKKLVPQWNVKSADSEANAVSRRGGFVRTETNYSALENLPLREILAKAGTLRGRTEDFLVEAEPFQGFVDAFPVKAFSSLNLAAQNQEYPDWAWRLFLNAKKREEDKPLFMMLIAERLCRYPDEAFDLLISEATSWLNSTGKKLINHNQTSFYNLFDKLLDIGKKNPQLFQSGIRSSKKKIDWVSVAINSPVSPLLQSLFHDLRLDTNKREAPVDWLTRVSNTLQLGDDISRYALVICNHNLGWFYERDAKWTRANLLSVRESADSEIRRAFWSGFFWGAKVPSPELYRELRESLLEYVQGIEFSNEGYSKVLAGILLSGWGSIDETTEQPYISNDEFREFLVKCDDDYRSHVLWQIRIWITQSGGNKGWKDQLIKLLTDVWPKQITVKSPATTMRLCELAFSSKDMFEKTARSVLPHLIKLNSRSMTMPIMRTEKDQIIKSNPELVLTIIFKILSDDINGWPYQIGEVLDSIEEVDPDLKYDERMIEIRRKWNSR